MGNNLTYVHTYIRIYVHNYNVIDFAKTLATLHVYVRTLAYTYFKKCYYEIFNQRKQGSSSYVCLAEQYLRTC